MKPKKIITKKSKEVKDKGVIKDGNKTIVKSSGAKNLRDLLGK